MNDWKDIAAALLGTDKVEAVEMAIGPDTDMTPVRNALRDKFFRYITECAALLGCDAAELLNDPCWIWCMDDGLTPAEAVAKYREACR